MNDNQSPADIQSALSARFHPSLIERRKIGGGREVDYVSGSVVISRLNRVVPNWSVKVADRWTQRLEVTRWNEQTRQGELQQRECMCILAELTIPELGTRSGIGVQILEPGAGEDPLKGALTDAIKNCAKQFGVGLHLYGLVEEETGEVGPAASPGSQSGTDWSQSAPANPAYERAAPSNGPMQPTERQSKLIDTLAGQLHLDRDQLDQLCQEVTGYGLDNIGRKSASALIEALQGMKQERAQGNGAAPSGGQTTPQSGGTPGGGGNDALVQKWVRTIQGAASEAQLSAMRATLEEAGLINHPAIQEALNAGVPQDVPF